MEIDKSGIRKVPVALNKQEDKRFFLELDLEFFAEDQATAKALHTTILDFLHEHDVAAVKQTLSVGGEEGTAPIVIFTEEENDADTALRKLTENRGNKLWISYLQTQLKAAQGFKS